MSCRPARRLRQGPHHRRLQAGAAVRGGQADPGKAGGSEGERRAGTVESYSAVTAQPWLCSFWMRLGLAHAVSPQEGEAGTSTLAPNPAQLQHSASHLLTLCMVALLAEALQPHSSTACRVVPGESPVITCALPVTPIQSIHFQAALQPCMCLLSSCRFLVTVTCDMLACCLVQPSCSLSCVQRVLNTHHSSFHPSNNPHVG